MRVYLYCVSCHKDLESGHIDKSTSLCFSQDMYYAEHVQKGHELILRQFPVKKTDKERGSAHE